MAQNSISAFPEPIGNQSPASKPSQTLGKWLDNLLGDKKARERAANKAAERRKTLNQSPPN